MEDIIAQRNAIPQSLTHKPLTKKRAAKSVRNLGPATLSLPKRRKLNDPETPAASSLPSQKGLDSEMAIAHNLGSFSQQDEPIEVHRPATAPCTRVKHSTSTHAS